MQVEAGRIHMYEPGLQTQARGGMRRHVAEELGHPIAVETVERPAERIVVEVLWADALAVEPLGGFGVQATFRRPSA